MSTSPAKPEAGDTSPAAPPKPPPPPGLDAAQRLALYRDALNQSAFIASGALKEELLVRTKHPWSISEACNLKQNTL
jgi:hypothetical protein